MRSRIEGYSPQNNVFRYSKARLLSPIRSVPSPRFHGEPATIFDFLKSGDNFRPIDFASTDDHFADLAVEILEGVANLEMNDAVVKRTEEFGGSATGREVERGVTIDADEAGFDFRE